MSKAAAVFDVLAKHLTADVVKEVGAVYRFDVDDRSWVVDLKSGNGSIKEVTGTDAGGDCTIKMGDAGTSGGVEGVGRERKGL